MSLEDIREKKQSKWIYVVIGLLLVGMAGFGTSQFGIGGAGARQALLSTGDVDVSFYEYENTLRYVQRQNPQMPIEQARQLTINSLKQRLVLENYLSEHTLTASDAQVNEVILNNPSFFDNGKFNKEAFQRAIGMPAKDYRQSVSNELAMQEFQKVLVDSAVVSQADIAPYLDNFSRDIRVVSIARDKFSYTPTESDIEAYYDKHKSQYMTDEKVAIEYVDFNPDEIVKTTPVSDAEVLAQLAPKRTVDYWIFDNEQNAQKAFEAYQNGQSPDAVKKTFSKEIQDSGELDKLSATVGADSLISQTETNAIFALDKVGALTAPMNTENGVMIFELKDKGSSVVDAAEKAQVKRQLQLAKSQAKVEALSEKLGQVVFEQAAPSLEDAAKAVGMTVQKTQEHSLNDSEGILSLAELADAIAKSDKVVGQLQEPVTIGDRVIIYRFSSVVPAQQKTLAMVKGVVSATVTREKVDQQMAKAAAELIAKSKKEGLQKAAQVMGYRMQDYSDFQGETTKGSILDPIAAMMIAKQSPQLGAANAREVISPAGGRYVYTTTAVRQGNSLSEKEQQQLKEILAPQLGNMALGNFMSGLMTKTKIKDHSAKLLAQ